MKPFVLVFAALAAMTPVSAFADSLTMLIPDLPAGSPGGFTQNHADHSDYDEGVDAGPSLYLIAVANVTFSSDGSTDLFYAETAVSATGPYTITITNDPPSEIDIADFGYFISPAYIPLDNLYFGVDPPPHSPNSPFTSLPSLDDASLGFGDSLSTTITPLPSAASMGMAGLGIIGTAGLLRKKLRPA